MTDHRSRDEIEWDLAIVAIKPPAVPNDAQSRLAADVGPLLERLDEQAREIERLRGEADDLRRQLLDETYRTEGGEIVMRELDRMKAERDALRARERTEPVRQREGRPAMTVSVFARREDGTEVDVTGGVQALYDHCVQSLDWGSGFLSVEDAEGIIRIAQTCGFLMPEQAAAAFEGYARRYGDGNGSNIICAVCGERATYSYATKPNWQHVDHDPGHPVQLWR